MGRSVVHKTIQHDKGKETYHFVVGQAVWDCVALVDGDGLDAGSHLEIQDETNHFHW